MAENNLNFSKALEALKSGKRIARTGWNGNGNWWLKLIIKGDPSIDPNIPEASLPSWIGVKSPHLNFMPCSLTHVDILAEDWEILE